MRSRTTLALWAGVLVALVPIALVTWYVAVQGNAAPVGDQWWDVTYIAVKTRTGNLTAEDMFLYFGGHRPLLIRLITVIFTFLTDYDVRILRFAAVFTAVLNLIMASLLVAHKHKHLLPLAIPLFSLVLFTLYHEMSWLDFYFSLWQQPLFFLLAALLVIQRMRPGWSAFVLIIGCALGATFSLGIGIAAWFSLPLAWLAKRAYRNWKYLAVWGLAFAICFAFYFSSYAVSPNDPKIADSLQSIDNFDVVQIGGYLLQFLSARFNSETINYFALALAVIGMLLLVVNSAVLVRREAQLEMPASWLSLALFAIVGAVLTSVGRHGVIFPVPARYSPGADGFWLALVALALVIVALRPRLHPLWVAANAVVLVLVVVFTVQKDIWLLQRNADPYPPECDQCVLDTPLRRDDCFRTCFPWGNDQSVYHFAALRLSTFRDVPQRLILPESTSPVVSDMPHRWLGVYVRDYLLAGVPPQRLTTIAPEQAKRWRWQPNPIFSPFYRGEWSTDILPHPLENVWNTPESFAADLSAQVRDYPRVWYINTPQTEVHFAIIDAAFAKAGYTARRWALNDPRDATASFGVWCYAANDADTACTFAEQN